MIKDNQSFQPALPDIQTNRPPEPPTISGADYEQMYRLLFAYRFDTISFFELPDKIEVVLHTNMLHDSYEADAD